jgi:dimethylaniline monooxygenase (N-oxide forming)
MHDRSIAILGTPLVPNSYHTSVVQALYAIAAIEGTLQLPSSERMEREIAYTNSWCRHRYPVHGYKDNVLEFEMVGFTDRLLEELGLESHRLGRDAREAWKAW